LFQVSVGPGSLDLTRREFELLRLLAHARGTAMRREEIYLSVWGYGMVRGDGGVLRRCHLGPP
jgi:DNA-binding response OmpR family regulator